MRTAYIVQAGVTKFEVTLLEDGKVVSVMYRPTMRKAYSLVASLSAELLV